ncbi:MAG: class I SAM-dependent methyltransferase [Pseudomonadales bacterium]
MPNISNQDSSTQAPSIQSKWNNRYQNSTDPGNACWVLENNLHLLPATGHSLDLACGLGANALRLAEQGLNSHGWDSSTIALEKLSSFATQRNVSVTTLLRDVEKSPPDNNSFDVIVVSQFLYRPILPELINALKPGGLLFYQTFNQQKLTSDGPSHADFLLAPNELLHVLSPLELIFYREDGHTGKLEQGLRNCSYFIGKRRYS